MITVTIEGERVHMFIGSTVAPICQGDGCRYCKWWENQEAKK